MMKFINNTHINISWEIELFPGKVDGYNFTHCVDHRENCYNITRIPYSVKWHAFRFKNLVTVHITALRLSYNGDVKKSEPQDIVLDDKNNNRKLLLLTSLLSLCAKSPTIAHVKYGLVGGIQR